MEIKICKFDCGCIGIPLEKFSPNGLCKALILESCEGQDLTIQGVYYNVDEPMEADEEGLRVILADLRKKMYPSKELEEIKSALRKLRRFIE